MDKRKLELDKLTEYIDHVDKETTLLLQNLQWDYKHLLESPEMVSCMHVPEHRIPLHSAEVHEPRCFLAQEGYSEEEPLLPDPVNPSADTVVHLSKQDIMKIINAAATVDLAFRRGSGAVEPLSVARLQHAYSADERRAVHDAVVAAAPACHDLADLALTTSDSGPQASKVKSRSEILAELRDMKRRRARYRVAAKTCNYSDVLRDVIKTQMDLYAEAKGIFIKTEYGGKSYVSLNKSPESETHSMNKIVIKQERLSPESESNYTNSRRRRESNETPSRSRLNTEQDHREMVSRRRRYDTEYGSHKTEEDKERRAREKDRKYYDSENSRRDTHSKNIESAKEYSNRYDNRKTEESSSSKHERDRKRQQYDRNYDDSYRSSKDSYEHRSSREISSKQSKYDRRSKYDDYQRNHRDFDMRREQKSRHCYDDQIVIKKEKADDYEDSNKDTKKRQKNYDNY